MRPLLATLAVLTAPEPLFSGFDVAVDEDNLGVINHDQNYTGGASVGLNGRFIEDWHLDAPLRALDWLFFLEDNDSPARITLHRFTFGVTAFTPDNISTANILPQDRPYASLTFANIGRVSIPPGRAYAVTSEFALAVLGLDDAKAVQSAIHRALGYGLPQGWSHQIACGGELTGRYSVALQRLITPWSTPYSQVYTLGRGELGYYTALTLGLGGQFGLVDGRFWQTFNPNKPADEFFADAPELGSSTPPERSFWVYAFVETRARGVLYNALLQGQLRHSDVTLSVKQVSHLVAEFDVGLTCAWHGVHLSYALRGRSREFIGPFERTHVWGSLLLGYNS